MQGLIKNIKEKGKLLRFSANQKNSRLTNAYVQSIQDKKAGEGVIDEYNSSQRQEATIDLTATRIQGTAPEAIIKSEAALKTKILASPGSVEFLNSKGEGLVVEDDSTTAEWDATIRSLVESGKITEKNIDKIFTFETLNIDREKSIVKVTINEVEGVLDNNNWFSKGPLQSTMVVKYDNEVEGSNFLSLNDELKKLTGNQVLQSTEDLNPGSLNYDAGVWHKELYDLTIGQDLQIYDSVKGGEKVYMYNIQRNAANSYDLIFYEDDKIAEGLEGLQNLTQKQMAEKLADYGVKF